MNAMHRAGPIWGRPFQRLLLTCLLAGLVVGCGASKGDISGKVTFEDKPIPWGRITFISQVGKKISKSSAIKAGRYEIKDFPAGAAQVSVESFEAKAKKTEMPKDGLLKGFTPPTTVDEP